MLETKQQDDFHRIERRSEELLNLHPNMTVSNGSISNSTVSRPAVGFESGKIALAVGCELAYSSPARVPILLQIQPLLQESQALVSETFASVSGEPIQRAIDAFGNPVMRTVLMPGYNSFRYEAVVLVSDQPDATLSFGRPDPIDTLPLEVVRYTLPSRHCESDLLLGFASQLFGTLTPGVEQAGAICDWVHRNIEYRYGSGSPHLSAQDVLERGFGVCRDLAHAMVALCRALDIPARYVAGYVPALAENKPDAMSDMGIDFHAYCEVFLAGRWLTFDPRHNRPLTGRVKTAHGLDAVNTSITTIYGDVAAEQPKVWTHEIDLGDTNAPHSQT